jgi:hypothetical protein
MSNGKRTSSANKSNEKEFQTPMEQRTKKYLEARKVVETKKEGEYELNKIHVITIESKEIYDLIVEICKGYDDSEDAYYRGIYYSVDELYSIDVNKFIETLKEEIQNKKRYNDYTLDGKTIIGPKNLLSYLENYQGYVFYFMEDEVND